LRSDTVTAPGPAMRKAMAEAAVGDDVQMEDPTVNELQRYAAELTGMEDALFVTSGTQGNLVSVLTHCGRGEGAILGRDCHIYCYEGGGLAVLGGIHPLVADDSSGLLPPEAVAAACHEPDVHYAPARLLCLENTHCRAGGLAIPVETFSATVAAARRQGLRVHLDGARLFNACAKWEVDVTAYTSLLDSVQLCLSKGLGAPVGSLVCGSGEFIAEARHWRKRVGGGMRQAGVLAAAGLMALKDMRLRLAEDHAKADALGRLLREGGLCVEESPWRTNMVFMNLPEGSLDAAALVARCAEKGVLFGAMADRRVRLVAHADVTREEVEEAGRVILAENALHEDA